MRRVIIIVIGVLASLVVCGLLFPSTDKRGDIFLAQLNNVREIATPPAELLAKKAAWLANPIPHYRLNMKYKRSIYPEMICFNNIEVMNETVVKTFIDSCVNANIYQFSSLAQTVTELFAKFETDKTTIIFKEKGHPDCPYFMDVDISYSTENYPTKAHYKWVLASPWNLGPKTYQTLYGDDMLILACMSMADLSHPDMEISVERPHSPGS